MKILFIDTVHPLLKEKLEKLYHNCDTAYKKNKSEIEAIIKDYDGIIIRSKFNIDQKFINKATNLKFIARAGSGLENIDVAKDNNFTAICYLNDNFKGGRTLLENKMINPETGKLIVFNSQKMEHGVEKVMGDRFTYISWWKKQL